MRSLIAACVAGLVLLAGCLAGPGAFEEDLKSLQGCDVEETTKERTFDDEGEVGVSATGSEQIRDMGWRYDLASVEQVDVALSWSQPSNGFGVLVAGPDGEARIDPPQEPQATEVSGSVGDLGTGTYDVRVIIPAGATVPDDLALDAEVTQVVTSPCNAGSVEVRQEGGDWIAEITYGASGEATDRMTAQVDVANGRVEAATDGDMARVEVTAWARADSRSAAVDRVEEIAVEASVDGDEIRGLARVPDDDWNNRGAHATVATPARLDGTLDTSNGPVDLRDLDGGDLAVDTSNGPITVKGTFHGPLTLDTSNGPIQGTVTLHDDTTLDTSNGPIDVDVTPESSLTLDADTSNGPIDLGLTERGDVAYTLDAETSNGQITEDMEEASLRYEDDDRDEATLRTDGGDGRDVQVTGTVGTSNGPIHFQGL